VVLFRLEQFPRQTSAAQVDPQRFGLSALLRAASRVVPFTGRTTELSQLKSWRDAPGQLSVILVFGPGGQGKTRLASQFADDSEMAGWAVAQARHRSDPRPRLPLAGDLREDQAGVLVVVDYAERWPRLELEQLLQHRMLSRAGRARVLLLARPAGYWWKALANPLMKLGAVHKPWVAVVDGRDNCTRSLWTRPPLTCGFSAEGAAGDCLGAVQRLIV
jgi:AAA ATPase domain